MMRRPWTVMMIVLTAICVWSQSSIVTWEGAYHIAPPKVAGRLVPILSPQQLWGDYGGPVQKQAYAAAAANSSLVYQLPCKCHCERQGHTSLRSCFESLHGAACDVCMKEVLYAGGQARKGKTVAQIREGINRGDYNRVNLEFAVSQ